MNLFKSKTEKFFDVLIYSIMILLALLCILPVLHVLAVSLSDKTAVAAGKVVLWPIEPTLVAYEYVFGKDQFMTSLIVSVKRLLVGVPLWMLVILITAYPLSKSPREFKGRQIYMWFMVFAMLFSGGMVPTYVTLLTYGLIDSFWVLILPGAVSISNIILMMNFFRGLPKALEESAYIDGANHFQVLWNIYVPLSKPAMATIGLFVILGHWNSWFDGMIYINSPKGYPLQTYVQTIISSTKALGTGIHDPDAAKMLALLSDKTIKCAQVFITAFPVLAIYPFLQKYFMKGLVMGSVKG